MLCNPPVQLCQLVVQVWLVLQVHKLPYGRLSCQQVVWDTDIVFSGVVSISLSVVLQISALFNLV